MTRNVLMIWSTERTKAESIQEVRRVCGVKSLLGCCLLVAVMINVYKKFSGKIILNVCG
jgi:hypothetical protein